MHGRRECVFLDIITYLFYIMLLSTPGVLRVLPACAYLPNSWNNQFRVTVLVPVCLLIWYYSWYAGHDSSRVVPNLTNINQTARYGLKS
ncbi:hypothetical protein QR685DRAFT_535646 [Neurospora intermedia]|uniref:Uncharacterized protein n=1 Tax=Neurospora intermedia TaxID=5142 RepID=A0ABR3D2Z5_NEUIN